MKKLIAICAAALATAALAADTDVGAIVTDKNIEDVATVENLTGANAGKATVTIKDNSGTANAVTVYNATTIDTALAGKASTGDLATAEANAQAAANTAYANATNNAAQTYVAKSGDSMSGTLSTTGTDVGFNVITTPNNKTFYRNGKIIYSPVLGTSYELIFPTMSGTLALMSDVSSATNTLWGAIPSWARADAKPSYNFSEIGSKPTTLGGYGITDATIANGTITLGANSITPLTSYTETDPVFTAAKPTMDAATAAKVPLSNVKIGGTAITAETVVELGQYYVKTVDGKPHLFARGN